MAVRGQGGFTLIEVLVAMVVLAVGLLAVQALGIGAARAVSRAGHQNELTAAVVAVLERRDAALRLAASSPAAGESCETDPTGEVEVCVTISDAGIAATGLWRYELRAAHVRSLADTVTLYWYRHVQPQL